MRKTSDLVMFSFRRNFNFKALRVLCVLWVALETLSYLLFRIYKNHANRYTSRVQEYPGRAFYVFSQQTWTGY